MIVRIPLPPNTAKCTTTTEREREDPPHAGLNVIVRIPLPPNTAKCTTTTAAGKAKYEPETSELVRPPCLI